MHLSSGSLKCCIGFFSLKNRSVCTETEVSTADLWVLMWWQCVSMNGWYSDFCCVWKNLLLYFYTCYQFKRNVPVLPVSHSPAHIPNAPGHWCLLLNDCFPLLAAPATPAEGNCDLARTHQDLRLPSHFPARGRTNLELREKFILPEGGPQGLTTFRSRGRRSKPGSRNASPTRSSSSASHSGASLPSAPSAPTTPTTSASSRVSWSSSHCSYSKYDLG